MLHKNLMHDEYRTSIILAGGRSSRFGSNKALAKWDGHTILENIVATLKKTSDEIVIIANDPSAYEYLGVQIIRDRLQGAGPIAGILSALYYLQKGQRAMVVACDMPLLNPDLLNYMWKIHTWAPAVVPEHKGCLEPLHTIYHKSLLYPIEYAIKNGWLSLRHFLSLLPLHIIPDNRLKTFYKNGLSCFTNINTQEEYQNVKSLVER